MQGRVIGTYLHGPVLARNPELADLLLSWVIGRPLPPVELVGLTELRRQQLGRLSAASRRRRRRPWNPFHQLVGGPAARGDAPHPWPKIDRASATDTAIGAAVRPADGE